VSLASGSTIVTNGGADGGELLLEAPVYGTNDVAINVGRSGLGADVSGVGKIVIESVLPTFQESNATIAANLGSDVAAAASYLSGAAPAISARLDPEGNSRTTVQAGVEVDDTNSNETLVLPALDLSAYSSPYSGAVPQVIDLTVRAAGNLRIGGNITDGFDAANGGLYPTGADSASLRFVAGADLSSANPLSTVSVPFGGNGATLTVGTPAVGTKQAVGALVSTGTGDIELAAAGNVNFLQGSSVYTTGTQGQPTKEIGTGNNVQTVNFPTGGGNVIVKAGQDVTGILPSDDVSVSYWEGRDSVTSETPGSPTLAEWGVNLNAFNLHPWAAATFGGGDVSVTAGRDVSRVTIAAADSLSGSADGTIQTLLPGGGLTVTAGRDVTAGEFFAADGAATLTAGRSFATVAGPGASGPLGSTFYVQNAQVSLWSRGDITISGLFNPTVIYQSNAATTNATYWSYGSQASFSAQSTSGDITYVNPGAGGNTAALQAILGASISRNMTGNAGGRLGIVAPGLRLVSLTGDLNIASATLYPSSLGQLELFAGKDIAGSIFMSDAPLSLLSTATNVVGSGGALFKGSGSQAFDFFANLHANDSAPAVIVAGEDINNLTVSVPKAADIEAGRDILGLTFYGENLNPNDITFISAGRDFSDPTSFDSTGSPSTSNAIVQIGGPGSLMLLAGRDIDLGFSNGVTTIGNLKNSNLPSADGASITMAAGLGDSLNNPHYNGFYEQIIASSSTYQQQLVSYVESLTGATDLSTDQADARFLGFSAEQQQELIDSVFFNELSLSGVEANKAGGDFKRGYTAIDALFPGSRTGTSGSTNNPYKGDLNLTYSQIYTESGGGISLLVPGGSINVGLAVAPAVLNAKQPSQLGIVAEGVGDVNIYAKSDVNVDSSRVFTLGGGNILIWSDEGNIDAGKGSKTSLSAPPPTYAIDAQGNVVTTFGAAVAGSGIRTIQTSASEAAGNVNLIAPAGFVNAGEAGIGAAGSVNIAALAVLNAANISYGSTATGVPPAVSGITASLASAASAASSATTSVTSGLDTAAKEEVAPLSQTAISWLDVFVSGLGEDNCKPEDTECLKRQKQE
jgi:hypothetical protein